MRIRLILLLPGLLLSIGMLLMLPWRFLSILTSGLMVAERISSLLGVLKLLVLVSICLLLGLLLIIRFGARLKSMVMLVWPCHLGIDNLNVARSIGCLLDSDCISKPLPLVKDGDLIALARFLIRTRGRETVRVTKVKGHAEDVGSVSVVG